MTHVLAAPHPYAYTASWKDGGRTVDRRVGSRTLPASPPDCELGPMFGHVYCRSSVVLPISPHLHPRYIPSNSVQRKILCITPLARRTCAEFRVTLCGAGFYQVGGRVGTCTTTSANAHRRKPPQATRQWPFFLLCAPPNGLDRSSQSSGTGGLTRRYDPTGVGVSHQQGLILDPRRVRWRQRV